MPRQKAKPESAEQATTQKKRKPATQYRDERGVRKQTYRRFKEGVDYLPVEPNEMVAMYKIAKDNVKRDSGRPAIFNTVEQLQDAISEYWEYLIFQTQKGSALLPDVEGLAAFLHISRETINEWERSNYNGFSATIKSVKNDIAACKKQLALGGKIPPIVFATDFNNNHGYTQKQELVVTPNNPLGEIPDQKALEERINGSVVEE